MCDSTHETAHVKIQKHYAFHQTGRVVAKNVGNGGRAIYLKDKTS